MITLNIIGAGRVGKALAKAWIFGGVVEIKAVKNKTLASAERAVSFLGQGVAADSYTTLPQAELWMIAVNDDALPNVIRSLSQIDLSQSELFHCSGSNSSKIATVAGARSVASLHPVKNIYDAVYASKSFAGTPFVLEGDEAAIRKLTILVQAIGGKSFKCEPEQKALYHAGLVMGCNNLTALMSGALNLLSHAGFSESDGKSLLAPLLEETLHNTLHVGAAAALTGPIVRGDIAVIEKHLNLLRALDLEILRAYASLGILALPLALERGLGRAKEIQLRKLFEGIIGP